jgi:alanine dehydrogenase
MDARGGDRRRVAATRQLERVEMYSRTPANSAAFAARVRQQLASDCQAVPSPEPAVRDHAVVVLATSSRVPVIDVGWLAAGTHVTTVGPKQRGAAEFALDLVERADAVVAASLAQPLRQPRPAPVIGQQPAADQTPPTD